MLHDPQTPKSHQAARDLSSRSQDSVLTVSLPPLIPEGTRSELSMTDWPSVKTLCRTCGLSPNSEELVNRAPPGLGVSG